MKTRSKGQSSCLNVHDELIPKYSHKLLSQRYDYDCSLPSSVIVVLDKCASQKLVDVDDSEQKCVRDDSANGSLRQKAVRLDVVSERGFLRRVGLSIEPPV